MSERPSVRTIEAAAVVLFWLQATRALFSVLFGVVYDAIFDSQFSLPFAGLILGATLLAFVAPATLRRGRSLPISEHVPITRSDRMGLFALVLVTAVARVPVTLEDPQLRLAGALVVIGAANLYLFLLLRTHAPQIPVVVVLALLVDQLARARGVTWDVTLQPNFLPVQIVICLGVIAVAWAASGREHEQPTSGQSGAAVGPGLGAFLFLETAIMAQPNVLARWTGVPYEWVAPILLVVTAFPLIFVAGAGWQHYGGRPLVWLRRCGVLARAVPVLGALLGLLLGRAIGGWAGLAGLLLAQLLLVLTLPLMMGSQDSTNVFRGGAGLAWGMVCFLLLHLVYAFAFTYPYTMQAFRNSGAPITVVAAGIALLPIALRAPEAVPTAHRPVRNRVLIALTLALVAVMVWSRPESTRARKEVKAGRLRVATYNIHYGYDAGWAYSLEEQARAIQDSGADVVFVQEVDAGRLTSLGVDDALWLGRRLGMQAVFAPTLEGLSGIALLSRLPVLESDWALLPSEQEQTALVHAVLEVEGKTLDAYGVWLGLQEGERMGQAGAALERIRDVPRVVLGGDMNSRPGSPVHVLFQDSGLIDPFGESDRPADRTSPAVMPRERIDYLWVRGVEILEARVSSSLASDHRLVMVELSLVE